MINFIAINMFAQQTYRDALLQEAKGNVKTITYVSMEENDNLGSIDYSTEYNFKSNGEQIRQDDKCIERKRDQKGRIIFEKYIFDSESRVFKYTYGSNGLISKIICTDSDGTQIDSYIYNNKGAVIKTITTKNNKIILRQNFIITAYDSKGNWIKRKSKTPENKLCEEIRSIEYW